MVGTASPAIWISNFRLGAELEQSFVAIKYEQIISGVQLAFERSFTGHEALVDRVCNFCIFIPPNALVDEAVDDVRAER